LSTRRREEEVAAKRREEEVAARRREEEGVATIRRRRSSVKDQAVRGAEGGEQVAMRRKSTCLGRATKEGRKSSLAGLPDLRERGLRPSQSYHTLPHPPRPRPEALQPLPPAVPKKSKRKSHGLTIKIESPTTGEDSSAGIVEGAGLPRSPNIYLSGVSISRSPSEPGSGRSPPSRHSQSPVPGAAPAHPRHGASPVPPPSPGHRHCRFR
jgi:hypothetical protein